MTREGQSGESVLFVCTGNIFRSLPPSTRCAPNCVVANGGRIVVESAAGTEDFPHVVNSRLSAITMNLKGLDVRAHRRRNR
jgi:protein-tyrosine-phosphatase